MADFLSGLDILTNSSHRFRNILCNLKLLVELCRENKVFSDHMLDKMELVLTSFKDMGSQSSATAKMAAIEWVDEVIHVYLVYLN